MSSAENRPNIGNLWIKTKVAHGAPWPDASVFVKYKNIGKMPGKNENHNQNLYKMHTK